MTGGGPGPPGIGRGQIEAGLRDLGLRRGDAVEVHSSLSRFGYVEGGAAAVVDALMAVVGPEGAIAMSAYPLTPPLPLTEQDRSRGIQAKVRLLAADALERTGMGAIADEFRRRPGVAVGAGSHPICAWGREAHRHCRHGYARLIAIDGWALLLGVDIHRCSSLHVAEDRVGLPAQVTAASRVPEEILRDYPPTSWYVQCGGAPEDAWQKVWDRACRDGLVRSRQIGQSQCHLFRAGAMVALYEGLLRADALGLFGYTGDGRQR